MESSILSQNNITHFINISLVPDNVRTPTHSTVYIIIMLIITIPLVIITVIGNGLILIAWFLNPSIRTPSNGYLFSLAIVDTLTGLIVMPLGIVYDYNRRWIFGDNRTLCQFQLMASYGITLVGSLHLVQIAVDRYRILNQGVHYLQRQSLKSVLEFAIVSWLIGLWIVSPIALDWENVALDVHLKKHCVAKKSYLWVSSSFLPIFILPMFLLARIYYSIFNELKRRQRLKIDNSRVQTPMPSTSGNPLNNVQLENSSSGSGEVPKLKQISAKLLSLPRLMKNGSRDSSPTPSGNENIDMEEIKRRKIDVSITKERKSAKTVGFLIGTFYICWSPYVLLSLLKLFKIANFPSDYYYFCAILGWINSMANPIIYAVRNPDFKQAFSRIFEAVLCMR